MKKFLIKTGVVLFALICLELALVQLVPLDKNHYLYEYVNKLDLLKKTESPRVILVGGSSVAFSTISQMIVDSMNCNVVNFGTNAGVGARMQLADCLEYVREGDIIVVQMEYSNYFNGGCGEVPTTTQVMVNKGWWNASKMNMSQWAIVLKGIPRVAFSNVKRLFRYPLTNSFTTTISPPPSNVSMSAKSFQYDVSGYNKYGDQESHFNYEPAEDIAFLEISPNRTVDNKLIEYFASVFAKYKQKGSTVVMLPPACIDDYFEMVYMEEIGQSLESISYPYVIPPREMTLDNIYAFDTKYHLNREGATINTNRIIGALKPYMNRKLLLSAK